MADVVASRGTGDVTRGRVVIVNGVSSAGKTSIVSAFRAIAADEGRYWHPVGIDDVLAGLSWQWVDIGWSVGPGPFRDLGLSIARDGSSPSMRVGSLLRSLIRGYQGGVLELAAQGIDVVVDEVVLDATHRDGWQRLLGDHVVWVGVRCDEDELERREGARGDRPIGLARAQGTAIHAGITYSLELDSTSTPAEANARTLLAHLDRSG